MNLSYLLNLPLRDFDKAEMRCHYGFTLNLGNFTQGGISSIARVHGMQSRGEVETPIP